MAKLTRVGYPTSSGARGKTQAQARRKRACRVKGQSPLRSKFLVRLRSQEMGRASFGVSRLGADLMRKKHMKVRY